MAMSAASGAGSPARSPYRVLNPQEAEVAGIVRGRDAPVVAAVDGPLGKQRNF
jgi:hypothetical protein